MRAIRIIVRLLLTPIAFLAAVLLFVGWCMTVLPLFTLFDIATYGKFEPKPLISDFFEGATSMLFGIWGKET